MAELFFNFSVVAQQSIFFLLRWGWASCLVLGMVALCVWFLRTERPLFRYHSWLFGLLGIAFLPLASTLLTYSYLPLQPINGSTAARLIKLPEYIAAATPASVAAERPSVIWCVLLTIYLSAVIFFLFHLSLSYKRLRRLRQQASLLVGYERLRYFPLEYAAKHQKLPDLARSSEIDSPALAGLLHPMILLPADIDDWTTAEEREAIVYHELAHYEMGDHLIAFLQHVLKCFFFFHPAVRHALKQLSVERELVCDQRVVLAGVDPGLYAESILKVAERSLAHEARFQPTFYAAKRNLQRRIEMITSNRKSGSSYRLASLLLPIAAFCLVLWGGSARLSVRAQQQQTQNSHYVIAEPVDTEKLNSIVSQEVLRWKEGYNSSAPFTSITVATQKHEPGMAIGSFAINSNDPELTNESTKFECTIQPVKILNRDLMSVEAIGEKMSISIGGSSGPPPPGIYTTHASGFVMTALPGTDGIQFTAKVIGSNQTKEFNFTIELKAEPTVGTTAYAGKESSAAN
jgi:beta-lactamase regulating signal transducer with metallopeptidase domain